jgi:uncharacterized protein YndB with AHSA1/START domain
MSNTPAPGEAIVIERVFDAPVELVWQLWTQPEHFKQWYGPNGLSVPVAEMDVRVGGKHLICMEMQTPDGSRRMWSTGEYQEVIPNQRLVYTDSMADEQGNAVSPATSVTVVLENLNGRTKMVMTHAGLPTGGESASSGWEQAFSKMAGYIGTVLKATQ